MAKDSPNFASLLEEAPSEVSYPVSLPAGTYHCVVKGQPRYDVSSQKKTPFVEFNLVPQSALEDVDAEELTTWMDNNGKPRALNETTIRATYYTTEQAVYRLDEFHEHCGIDLTQSASRRNRNDECMNAEVLATIRHEASQDGQRTQARLVKTAPVE